MEGRHHAVAMFALAVTGGTLAWLLGSPLLLGIPAGLGALFLASQYQFVQDLQATKEALTVTQSLANRQVRATQSTTLTVDTTAPTLPGIDIELSPQLPAALTTTTTTATSIDAGDTIETYVLESEIAGRYEIPAPELTVTSRDGWFETSFELGSPVQLVVTPAGPREIHVGEGGERFAAAYGEHPAGKGGAGLDPSELRKYLPGDPKSRIDWKATARLNEPHVREFEAETDRETLIVLDTRRRMADGPTGETKLDYARQLALAFVDSADHLADPLALVTVDDHGITNAHHAESTASHYRTLRTTLHDTTTESTTDTTTNTPDSHAEDGESERLTRGGSGRDQLGPDTAYRYTMRLNGEESAFAAGVRPFLSQREAYIQRLDEQPLFKTVRRQLSQTSGRTWTIIVTDDSGQTETREAVKYARRQGGHVLVCLLPSILYEPGGLSDLDAAYTRYREFEEFRRSLAAIEGVRALEVGPRDRLAAILTHHRTAGGTPA